MLLHRGVILESKSAYNKSNSNCNFLPHHDDQDQVEIKQIFYCSFQKINLRSVESVRDFFLDRWNVNSH